MQVNVAGLRRAAKNIAHNYTDPQKKVREATSNDPWGPSSTLMSEIADLTYNIEAFAQIMEMLWKRLNDHGKNWRHVYKSLVLIEYLIKTGSERVAQQCKENIFAIQTLKDFQHLEENKDQGLNVREKAKQLVTLLGSEEKLRTERARALKARERFAQTLSGFGSSSADNSNETTPTGVNPSVLFNSYHGASNGSRASVNPELEQARPQTIGEEELQLQIALAMSKEEADQEEKRRRSDELRLQMALSQSENEFKTTGPVVPAQAAALPPKKESALLDLLDVDLGGGATALPPTGSSASGGIIDPWAPAPAVQAHNTSDPWNTSNNAGWHSPQGAGAVVSDPWSTKSTTPAKNSDPWGAIQSEPLDADDFDFDSISKNRGTPNSTMNALLHPDSSMDINGRKKDPLEFLGENKGLVNLDNLLPLASSQPAISPFGGLNNSTPNPFQNIIQKPSINEMRQKQLNDVQQGGLIGGSPANGANAGGAFGGFSGATSANTNINNNPWSPIKSEQNPFFN